MAAAPAPPSASRPTAHRSGRRPLALFALLAMGVGLFALAAAILVVCIPLLRERIHLHRVGAPRVLPISLGSLAHNQSPARREHLSQCYNDPKTNIDNVSWNMLGTPTPWVGYAPEPGDHLEGHFNRQQLRAARDLPLPKPAGEYRIFIVGGSLAYSMGSNGDAQTIAVLLEQRLRALPRALFGGAEPSVWNAAVCGYTSLHERLWIEQRLSLWQPDLIVTLTGVNDMHWGFEGADVRFMRSYEDEMYFELIAGALRVGKLPPYARNEGSQGSPNRVPPAEVAARFLRNQRLTIAGLDDLAATQAATQAAATQTSASSTTLAAARPLRYVIALQPTLAYKPQRSPGEADWLSEGEPEGKPQYLRDCFTAYDAGLRALLASRGGAAENGSGTTTATAARASVALLDLRDVFDGRRDPIFLDLYHVGDKGNGIIAEALAARLTPILQGQADGH